MKDERRHTPIRRQFNSAFLAPDGSVSVSKLVAFWAQVVVLYNLGKYFEKLIDHSDTMLVLLAVLIAPEIIKKMLRMKMDTVAQQEQPKKKSGGILKGNEA